MPAPRITAQRFDFKNRAVVLKDKAQRIISLIEYNAHIRDTDRGRNWNGTYADIGSYFRDFNRREWPEDDERAAQRMDDWERAMDDTLKELIPLVEAETRTID